MILLDYGDVASDTPVIAGIAHESEKNQPSGQHGN